MKLDRKQRKFLEKLANNDVIVGYDKMQDLLNEYLDAFVKPKFKELKLHPIRVSFVEKDPQRVIDEALNDTNAMGGYTYEDEILPGNHHILRNEEIILFKDYRNDHGGVFDRKSQLQILATIAHEYKHFVQSNVAAYNKRFDFSKEESQRYANIIGHYSQKVADTILSPKELLLAGHEVETLYNASLLLDDKCLNILTERFSEEDNFDFPLYLLQEHEIDARQFAVACMKELWDYSHEVDVLRKNKFVSDLGLFWDDLQKEEYKYYSRAIDFYIPCKALLRTLEEEDFFVKIGKAEQQELEKSKIAQYFAYAPQDAKEMKLKQDLLADVLDVQMKRIVKKYHDDDKMQDVLQTYYAGIYKAYIQHGISYAYDVLETSIINSIVNEKSDNKYTYAKLLGELIEENKPLCADSFEKFDTVEVPEAERIFKALFKKEQIRYVDTALLNVEVGEKKNEIVKMLLPLVKDKVNELNKQNLDASYDEVDEMLRLISTIKYTSMGAYPPIDQYADFDYHRADICKRYASKDFSEEEIGLLVDCEYSLELLGLAKVVKMRNGDAPRPDVYRFGHCQDRDRYLTGEAREEYVKQVYGEIELEKKRYYYDTRDDIARKVDPLADIIFEKDPVDDLPERIY